MALGFAGGVMIGLLLISLMPEGYFHCNSIFRVFFGFVCGLLMMYALSHFGLKMDRPQEGTDCRNLGYFIVLGSVVHNLPKGVQWTLDFKAVGTSAL